MKNIVILGSTGSIGTQTLEVSRKNPKKFKVIGLSCNKNIKLLINQIREFKPEVVCIKDKSSYSSFLRVPQEVPLECKQGFVQYHSHPRILSGLSGLLALASHPKADLIVNALSGLSGVKPTMQALLAKKNLALANKESLVYEGQKIMKLAEKNNITIIPLDSEHNAIFQCLQNENIDDIKEIVLTCSGGPFFGLKKKELKSVTFKDCLNHPTWKNMGKKILVDCATLVNKGLEVIEAKYLFNLKPEQIKVKIQRESKVHGIVYFKDGRIKAFVAPNDMKIPIKYALNYPKVGEKYITFEIPSVPFLSPDVNTFEGVKLGYHAAEKGVKYEKIFVKSNDKAVKDFLKGKIKFLDITECIKNRLAA